MAFLKCNISDIGTVCDDFEYVKERLGSSKLSMGNSGFVYQCSLAASGWENSGTILERFLVSPNRDDYETDDAYNDAYNSAVSNAESKRDSAIEEYRSICNSMISDSGIENVITNVGKMLEAMNNVEKLVTTFEENDASIKDILLADGSGYSYDESTGKYGIEIETTDADGNTITYNLSLSDALNALYTTSGISMDTMTLNAALGISESDWSSNVSNALGVVDVASATGLFGIASSEDQKGFYEEVMNEEYSKSEVSSKLSDILNEQGDLETSGISVLTSQVGSLVCGGASVVALAFGSSAYDQAKGVFTSSGDKITVVEEPTPEETPTPDAGKGSDGTDVSPSGSDSGSTPTIEESPVIVQEGDSTSEEEATLGTDEVSSSGDDSSTDDSGSSEDSGSVTVELEEIDSTPLPDELSNTLTDEDIDRLAREEYDAQFATEEEYGEFLADEMEDFDTLFDSTDKAGLKEKLSSYGYSEEEITYLLENKDVCLNAYLSGEQSKTLTDMANKIASSNEVETFDTSYDDTPDFDDLSDGDANVFITNENFNQEVSQAKSTYKEALSKYNEAVDTVNASIKEATESRNNITSLVEKYGDDTSKWTQEQVDSYNTAVKEYNSLASQAQSDYKNYESVKESLATSKENYLSVRDEYFKQIKNDNKINVSNSGSDATTKVEESNTTDKLVGSDDDLLGLLQVDETKIGVKGEG